MIKIFGNAGDVIETGHALAEFALDDGPQRAEGHATGHTHAVTPTIEAAPTPVNTVVEADDAGSVVGAVVSGSHVQQEAAIHSGGVKAVPAVRAMAKKLGLDLTRVQPSGELGIITMADVKRAAEAQTHGISREQPAVNASHLPALSTWLGRKDSNLRMPESKSGALTSLATPQALNRP